MFKEIPQHEWPYLGGGKPPVKVFISKKYLAQLFMEDNNITRLTVCSTKRLGNNWKDGITWDELQEIKKILGFSDSYAIEVYPKDKDLVNVANMRHLWILPEPLDIGWFNG